MKVGDVFEHGPHKGKVKAIEADAESLEHSIVTLDNGVRVSVFPAVHGGKAANDDSSAAKAPRKGE